MSEHVDLDSMDEAELRVFAQQQMDAAARARQETARAQATTAHLANRNSGNEEPEPSPSEALIGGYKTSIERGVPQDLALADAVGSTMEVQVRALKGVTKKEERAALERRLEQELEALRAEG
jgi:hypothetical protein